MDLVSGEERAIVVGPGEGETIRGPVGGPLSFKVRGAQTHGALTAFENVVPPGSGPPLHRHAEQDESWYVLEGRLRFKLDGEMSDAPAGTFVFVPRGAPHQFQNIGEGDARILVLFTPSGMEGFFDRLAELPAEEVGPQVFGDLGREAGMEVLGPPLAVSDPP